MVRVPVHPGEVLSDEIKELNIHPAELASFIELPETCILEVINGKLDITPDIALHLCRFFGTSNEFWMNLQKNYDDRLKYNTQLLEKSE